MTIKTILVPCESAQSLEAPLETAISLAKRHAARIEAILATERRRIVVGR